MADKRIKFKKEGHYVDNLDAEPDENLETPRPEAEKENIPAPVETQCQWLRDIGFQEVDCFFKTFELALFLILIFP